MRMKKDLFLQYILQYSWNIGFIEDSLDSIIYSNANLNIKWMKHDYTDRWFADPFILGADKENIYIFVEDFLRSKDKAHISLLTVNRKDYRLRNLEVVLEEPTHLSFPIIFREANKIMIYPENGASGSLKMYEFNPDKRRFMLNHTIADKALADTVLFQINKDSYLITTEGEEMNGRILNFYKKTESGFVLDRQITFDRSIARNAGEWFELNGKYYRPAQDCGLRYGAALELQEFNPIDFSLKTIRRFEPASKKYNLGIHTFNHYQGVSVVDGYGYDHPILAGIINTLVKIKGHGKK